MRRLFRLLAPALSATFIGLALLVFAPTDWLSFRGGLPVATSYAVVFEIVLTLLLVTVIDDSGDPRMLQPRLAADKRVSRRLAVESGFDLKRALQTFYVWRISPTLLLSFGISLNFSVLAIGVLDRWDTFNFLSLIPHVDRPGFGMRPSELAAGIFAIVVAVPLVLAGGRGFYGWAIGASLGSAVTQMRFDLGLFLLTAGAWSGFAAALCLVGYLTIRTVPAIRRRRIPSLSLSSVTVDPADRSHSAVR